MLLPSVCQTIVSYWQHSFAGTDTEGLTCLKHSTFARGCDEWVAAQLFWSRGFRFKLRVHPCYVPWVLWKDTLPLSFHSSRVGIHKTRTATTGRVKIVQAENLRDSVDGDISMTRLNWHNQWNALILRIPLLYGRTVYSCVIVLMNTCPDV